MASAAQIIAAVREIQAYETSDGETFKKQSEANKYQTMLDLGQALNENMLIGNYMGSHVERDTLVDWLTKNKQVVLNFIEEV